jgi:AraC-like DNA-binding protein
MTAFNYKLTTYTALLHQLADYFGVSVSNNTIYIPEVWGTGFFKVIDLGNGIESIVYHLKLTKDLVLNRKTDANEFYTLILDEVDKSGGFSISIEQEKSIANTDRNDALYLTSFLFDMQSILYRDIAINGLRVLLNLPWMQQYLQVKDKEDVLEKYINLKTAGIWHKQVDAESRELLHEVLSQQEVSLLSYQNKILRIVEKFFSWMYDETLALEERSGISRHDIESAHKVEGILTNDVTVIPPTITELSREVAMSESKLKKIFKSIYGLPPYEYFQKHRMQKARLMLLSGKYSIKDVGYTLGYSNLSNFTLAFKKAFGKLPSEMVRK